MLLAMGKKNPAVWREEKRESKSVPFLTRQDGVWVIFALKKIRRIYMDVEHTTYTVLLLTHSTILPCFFHSQVAVLD